MQPTDRIKQYRDTVEQQIRWKKAKPNLSLEIENHLCDQRDAYMASGANEQAAVEQAISQMGDPVLIGQELDKTHRPQAQGVLIALTALFMSLGILINYIISVSGNSPNDFSILPFMAAFGIFWLCYYFDFTILGKYALVIYWAALGFSVLAILGSTGVNGRLFWLAGNFPLSYLALIFPLVFALMVYTLRNRGYLGILLSGLAFLPMAVILILIPNMGAFILYSLASLTILGFAIGKGWFGVNKKLGFLLVLVPTFLSLAMGVVFIQQKAPYQLYRLSAFLNPDESLGSGNVYYTIRELLAGSVFWGKAKQGTADILSLPNIATDYSLTYLVHQFGLIVLLGITALIILFAVVAINKTLKQKSVLGSLVSWAIIATFIFQAVLYLVDNLGYGLVFSLSLPFISYGNSALLIDAALIGFMLSVYRTGDIYQDQLFSKKNNFIFSYADGKLVINLRRSEK